MHKWVKRVLTALLTALMVLLLLPLGLFPAAGAFDTTHFLYALPDEIVVEGAIAFPMIPGPDAIFEIPAELSVVTILPLKNYAAFRCFDGTTFRFGKIKDGTVGIFTLATQGANPKRPSLTITQKPVQDYTLTIDTNDGSTPLATVTQAMKSAYTLPVPERDGYSFRGWELSGGGGVNWGRGQGMMYVFGTGDGALTAQWRKLVTISYDTDGGSPALEPRVLMSGVPDLLPSAPTKSGYTFTGWKAGDTIFAAGAEYTVTDDVTFTAQWMVTVDVTITYNTDGGSPAAIAPVTVASGTSITLPAAPTKSGNIFMGWKTGSATLGAGASYTVTGDVTFTAQWEVAADVTITYNTDGGSPTIAPVTVPYGTSITLPAAPTKSGNIFMCWKTGSATLGAGESYTVTGDVTITAQWTKSIFGTNIPSTIWNWIVFIFCFGWAWMWFI